MMDRDENTELPTRENIDEAARRGRGRPRKIDTSVDKLGAKLPKKAQAFNIEIAPLKLGMMSLTLRGTAPLIVHRFGAKQQEQIRKKQGGEATQGRGKKEPVQDFLDCFYSLAGEPKLIRKGESVFAKGRFGFPTSGFKKAAVSAGDQVGLRPSLVSKAFHVMGEMTEIKHKSLPEMRCDVVRIGAMTKVADLRYRPYFDNWSVDLEITYNVNAITPSQIANLFNTAGFAIGVGDWRPQRGGNHGMFEVDLKMRSMIVKER